MNIFRYFRDRNRRAAQFVGFPRAIADSWGEPCELDLEFMGNTPHPNSETIRIFEATHMHVRTKKLYMLTSEGGRLEVTGDDAYPLAEYEDAEGNQYAQHLDRFMDGRFIEYAELGS